ncbi:oligopeptide:H+ symporter [Coxiella burnetii]|uniref:Di-/tripeptide transporter n=4 Tax=Coxiella burnetii TaxID=777 RepID=Q83DZ8_COXBU|nr:oligopeptide:H+ symporter [Coxiella burnetii]NP_819571.2 di-/tripeptide transporter [Coxiella burnetii RSA 493]AAO90085.2 di-/tripeptide transporter [Coxiella burnetii RSA 493]ACJ18757.1 di-/tripeptide transporter [Coxiella burnetii CbuG_Q212]ARI65415.1 MFS transporter [Coxiella burnetii]ARK26894.1 dipeptide/tripeptide permease [Coxiella burnetii]ATN67133.1 peptide ABC transporter permease [Coxiella burnetii]
MYIVTLLLISENIWANIYLIFSGILRRGKAFMSVRSLTGQPKPFYLIFFIEIWERFGYYGVQALLVLYMVERLGYQDSHADFLFAAFSALVFLLPCLGGYVGDKLLGTKRTILLGAIVLALGYLLLSLPAISNAYLALPLAFIAVGNGLFKANPSSLLSKVYEKTQHNLDSGFTLYYMAVNIGAAVSMNLTPILSKFFGWHVAFSVCCAGLVIAIFNFFAMRGSIADYGSKPDQSLLRLHYLMYVLLGTAGLIVGGYFLLIHFQIMSWLLSIGTVALLLTYFVLTGKAKPEERKGMFLFIILFSQAVVFFVLYFQMPTSLSLFALRNVHHSILGIPIEPAQFQMLNPLWVMIMSPVMAVIYQRLHKRGRDLSMPAKFSLGTFLAGLAFLSLPFGALFNHHGVISGMWLVLSYWLQSTGELLVSALGLSLAARYVPQRFMGFTMGLWFLCTSIASIIAGKVASIASIPKNISKDALMSLPIYDHLFMKIGLITVAISLVMFTLVPLLKKLAANDKQFVDKQDVAELLSDDQLVELS